MFLEIHHLKLPLSFLLYMTQTFHFLLKHNCKNHLLKIYRIFECIKKHARIKGGSLILEKNSEATKTVF